MGGIKVLTPSSDLLLPHFVTLLSPSYDVSVLVVMLNVRDILEGTAICISY